MGNIHTVGPNEALIVSGRTSNHLMREFRNVLELFFVQDMATCIVNLSFVTQFDLISTSV